MLSSAYRVIAWQPSIMNKLELHKTFPKLYIKFSTFFIVQDLSRQWVTKFSIARLFSFPIQKINDDLNIWSAPPDINNFSHCAAHGCSKSEVLSKIGYVFSALQRVNKFSYDRCHTSHQHHDSCVTSVHPFFSFQFVVRIPHSLSGNLNVPGPVTYLYPIKRQM